jgi:hypothetical protein
MYEIQRDASRNAVGRRNMRRINLGQDYDEYRFVTVVERTSE